MVIDHVYITGSAIGPAKYYSPLVVDSNAVEASPSSFQCFEAIPRRRAQITELTGIRDHVELSRNNRCPRRPILSFVSTPGFKKLAKLVASETLDCHGMEYTAIGYKAEFLQSRPSKMP